MKLPFGVSKTLGVWRQVSRVATRPAGIIVAGNPQLVTAARERFAAGGFAPAEWRLPADKVAQPQIPADDLLLALVTREEEGPVMAALATCKPRGGAIVAVDEGALATGQVKFVGLRCRRLSFADTEAGWQRLYRVCIQAAGERAVALARRYPVLREPAASYVITRAALQSAALGVASLLRGAHAPAMAALQLGTVLRLAALYGQELDQERVPELAAVFAGGLGVSRLSRLVERRVVRMAWLARVGVAVLATLAIGFAALHYYQKGAPWSTSRLISFANSLRR